MRITRLFFLMTLLGFAAGFSACSDEKETPPRPDRGAAYVRLIHGIHNGPDIDVFADYYNVETEIVHKLASAQPFPAQGYLKIESSDIPDEFGLGKYVWTARLDGATPDDPYAKPTELFFVNGEKYTIFVVADSVGDGKFLTFKDTFTKPDSGQFALRFINVSARPSVELLTNPSGFITLQANRLQATNFTAAPVSSIALSVQAGTVVVSGPVNFTPKSGKVYTAFYNGGGLYIIEQE